MKKNGILNHRLSDVIARMGHTQRLVIADAGLPIPLGVERIDLAVVAWIPGVLDLARAIGHELQVEGVVLAESCSTATGRSRTKCAPFSPALRFAPFPHEEFKRMCEGAVAIVRSGECTPYANIMLISGVTF